MAPDSDTLPAVDVDGKPAWLQRLMGNETSGTLLRQQSDISTDDEGGVSHLYFVLDDFSSLSTAGE